MARTKATQKKRMKQLRKLYPEVAEHLLEDKARQESVEAGRRMQEQELEEASRQQERKKRSSTRLDNKKLLKQVMSAKGKGKGLTADKVHINRRRYAVYDTESEDDPEIEEAVDASDRAKRHQLLEQKREEAKLRVETFKYSDESQEDSDDD